MLQPRIDIDQFTPRDITGFYPDNPTGWGGPNVSRIDVVNARLKIRFNQELIGEPDVTDQVRQSIDEVIEFPKIASRGDGVYKVYYLVDDLVSFAGLYFVHDQVKADISKSWASLAGCYDSYVYREWAKHCIFLDTHERMLSTFMRRGQEKEYLSTLRIVQERIETNKDKMPCHRV